MAAKPKSSKTKQLSKPKKAKPAAKPSPAKTAPKAVAKTAAKPAPKGTAVKAVKAAVTKPNSNASANLKKKVVPAPPSRTSAAVAALEAGIKLMFAEDYDKAIKAFNKVIVDFPEEAEIQASARARIQACEKKLQERTRAVFKSADDHYNVAVAFMNGGQIEPAVTHLQSALKLAPKADHILYAMAAAHALAGNKDQAITFLKQAIGSRPENRFQAGVDPDFASLTEEQAFRELLASPEK